MILVYMSIGLIVIESLYFSIIILLLSMASWSYKLFLKWQYRKGKSEYLHFPTQNDNFYRTSAIVLGLILVFGSAVAIIWKDSFTFYGIVGMANGLLLFLNGLFDLPKGKMILATNELSISGLKKIIDIRLLREVNIHNEKLILTDIDNEILRVDNLAIDTDSAKQIENYLAKNSSKTELRIINNVS